MLDIITWIFRSGDSACQDAAVSGDTHSPALAADSRTYGILLDHANPVMTHVDVEADLPIDERAL